jgi:hypothetical protein
MEGACEGVRCDRVVCPWTLDYFLFVSRLSDYCCMASRRAIGMSVRGALWTFRVRERHGGASRGIQLDTSWTLATTVRLGTSRERRPVVPHGLVKGATRCMGTVSPRDIDSQSGIGDPGWLVVCNEGLCGAPGCGPRGMVRYCGEL